jgi:hypothetical protein
MKKNIFIFLIFFMLIGFQLNALDLYGYVKTIQMPMEGQQSIQLDPYAPIIGFNEDTPGVINDVRPLYLSDYYYSTAHFATLLSQACAHNWCVKFTINAYEDNAAVSFIEAPGSLIPRERLIAEYLFNGNIKDTSGKSNHLTNYNETKLRNGFAYFDGKNDGLGLSYLNNMSTRSLTIALWIKAKTGERYTRIVEIGENSADSTAIVIDSKSVNKEKGFRYWVHTDTTDSRISASAGDVDYHDNEWHHVVFTYNSALEVMKLYVDGEEIHSQTATGRINSQRELNIGNHDAVDGGTENTFNGCMDNIRIYKRALTTREIALYYTAEKIDH